MHNLFRFLRHGRGPVKLFIVALFIGGSAALQNGLEAAAGLTGVGSYLVAAVGAAGLLVGATYAWSYVSNLRRSASDMDYMVGLLTETSKEEDVEDALRVFLDHIQQGVQAKYAAISIYDAGGEIEHFITLGLTEAEKKRIAHAPEGKGLLGHIQKHQQTMRLDKMGKHAASAGFPKGHPRMDSLLAAPIVYQGRSLGNLYLTEKKGVGVFSPADERFVTTAATMAAILINQKAAAQENRAVKQYLERETDKIGAVIDRLAEGDFAVEMSVGERDDNIARMKQKIAQMVSNLSTVIGQTKATAQSLSDSSVEILRATEQLASGTQEQSQQANEVAAAMEQMTRTIVENARTATRTAEVAEESQAAAQKGGTVVRDTTAKIREIAAVVSESGDFVGQLGASSEKINEITTVIRDIADQTNLLALNAAIEAARAGEHGQGFAVVADEVRQLAERTARATDEIEAMIDAIQRDTQKAVTAMARGESEVNAGIELADETGTALEEIVGGAQRTLDEVGQIATATEEQSTTSEQISRNVEAISTVSADAAEGVNEIARSARSMADLAAELDELVDQFELQSGSGDVPAQKSAFSTPREWAGPVA